jgi:hypothetical protein
MPLGRVPLISACVDRPGIFVEALVDEVRMLVREIRHFATALQRKLRYYTYTHMCVCVRACECVQ